MPTTLRSPSTPAAIYTFWAVLAVVSVFIIAWGSTRMGPSWANQPWSVDREMNHDVHAVPPTMAFVFLMLAISIVSVVAVIWSTPAVF